MNNNTIWPINIYVDNKQAEFFSKNITTTSKMRTTFNLKDAWIRELRDDKKVNIEHVNADVNPSDLLTKIHSNSRFNKLIKIINPIRINQIQVQKIQDQSEEEEDPKEGNG